MSYNINQNEIKGKFKSRTNKTYIFLTNGKILEEDTYGNIIEIDLENKKNIEKIKNEIGRGYTDIER